MKSNGRSIRGGGGGEEIDNENKTKEGKGRGWIKGSEGNERMINRRKGKRRL